MSELVGCELVCSMSELLGSMREHVRSELMGSKSELVGSTSELVGSTPELVGSMSKLVWWCWKRVCVASVQSIPIFFPYLTFCIKLVCSLPQVGVAYAVRPTDPEDSYESSC